MFGLISLFLKTLFNKALKDIYGGFTIILEIFMFAFVFTNIFEMDSHFLFNGFLLKIQKVFSDYYKGFAKLPFHYNRLEEKLLNEKNDDYHQKGNIRVKILRKSKLYIIIIFFTIEA